MVAGAPGSRGQPSAARTRSRVNGTVVRRAPTASRPPRRLFLRAVHEADHDFRRIGGRASTLPSSLLIPAVDLLTWSLFR
jgi:hypothetical protein